MADELASWSTPGYAEAWAGGDVLADLLALPRRISVALARQSDMAVTRVIDLGSGPGSYLAAFLETFPDAGGVWVDGSEAMLDLARSELAPFGDRVEFVVADVGVADLDLPGAEVVATSRLFHHFAEPTLRRLYSWAHDHLVPGGFFFNLDHFGAAPGWEPRYRAARSELIPPRPDRLAPHRHDEPLRSVPDHLAWLEAAGFEPPDVGWKAFHTALLTARRG